MADTALILGAAGQLGAALADLFADQGRAYVGLDRHQCDVTDPASVARALREHEPAVVFNCAAYNAVDQAEDEPDAAFRLNALAPGLIAASSRELGATTVHFSTDYVFGDGHTQPIDEGCTPEPLAHYARSKALGERAVLQNNPKSYVVRVCGLYSRRRHNFVRTMLKHGLAGRPLTVVADQVVSPTWVVPLARVTARLVHAGVHGTYHAVAHGECSWFEYARTIFDALGVLGQVDLNPTARKDWGAKARRPEYSVLDNRMLRVLGLDDLEGWEPMLRRFLQAHGEALVAEFDTQAP
ncbi:MAG: dTDP-4-dehydrorhamnose reductase [Myxococcota bacterium]